MGVTDQTHGDDYGQDILELSSVVDFLILATYARVWRDGGCVNVLLSIDIGLFNNVVQHVVSDHQLKEIKW